MKDRIERKNRLTRKDLDRMSPMDVIKATQSNPELFLEPPYMRLEYVPATTIIVEDGIVDMGHVKELMENIEKNTQTSETSLRCRLDENGQVVREVADGFHRCTGFKLKAIKTGVEQPVKASVMYGITNEQLYDFRILAVNSVRSISYARLLNWMEKSFENSKWGKRNFSLSQAVGVAAINTSGTRLNLSEKEVDELKSWIERKAFSWGRSIGGIYQDLLAVEKASPELLERVRIGAGPHGRKGEINPACFKIIVNNFPHNHRLQIKIADLSSSLKLDQKYTQRLVRIVEKDMSRQNLSEVFTNPDKTMKRIKSFNSGSKHLFAKESGRIRTDHSLELKRLRLENRSLREELARYQKEGNVNHSPPFYETHFGQTEQEEIVLQAFYKDNLDIDSIASKYNLLPNKIFALLQSAHAKYRIAEEEKQFRKVCLESNPEPHGQIYPPVKGGSKR